MRNTLCRAAGFTAAVLTIAMWGEGYAMVGNAPVIPRNCGFTQVTAQLGPDGTVRYTITGTCNGAPISGHGCQSPRSEPLESDGRPSMTRGHFR